MPSSWKGRDLTCHGPEMPDTCIWASWMEACQPMRLAIRPLSVANETFVGTKEQVAAVPPGPPRIIQLQMIGGLQVFSRTVPSTPMSSTKSYLEHSKHSQYPRNCMVTQQLRFQSFQHFPIYQKDIPKVPGRPGISHCCILKL